jgi:hypothetical protein
MKSDSFCVFIISHGRPDKVITLRTLRKAGYTGPTFIVCDNEDKTIEDYRKNYGTGMVLVFDKPHYASLVDSCDNFENRRTTTHARNACFDLAKGRCFEYFLVLADDYTSFSFIGKSQKNTTDIKVRNLDLIFHKIVEFIKPHDSIDSVCFMQSGDTIGGMVNYDVWNRIFPFKKRKAMNSFFCKTACRFWFFSRLNEDVNTYLGLGMRGRLFMTLPQLLIQQKQTQATAGGMSEAYLVSGTYVKSFYSVMLYPSFAKVTAPKSMNRLHHKISWNNAVPKIIGEEHRKA